MRGTVPFMPPEQMLDFKTVLPSGDLYATAATLYYLLTASSSMTNMTEGGDLIRILLEEPRCRSRSAGPTFPTPWPPSSRSAWPGRPRNGSPDANSMRRALKPFC